jgi:Flp pilus assembly protein protease CpaA
MKEEGGGMKGVFLLPPNSSGDDMMPIDNFILHPSSLILWAVVLVQDLRHRRISMVALVALAIASLIGQSWPWWIAVSAALAWPRRYAMLIVPVAIGLGVVTNAPPPAIALAGGALAWALGWWGGADSIALLALGLRHGLPGLLAGSVTLALAGAAVMIVRRRSALGLVPVLTEAMFLRKQEEDVDIPPNAEMPAAAALAVAGMALEMARLLGGMS